MCVCCMLVCMVWGVCVCMYVVVVCVCAVCEEYCVGCVYVEVVCVMWCV